MPKHSKKTINKVRKLNLDPTLTSKEIARKCKLSLGQVNYILYQLEEMDHSAKEDVSEFVKEIPVQKMSLKTYFDKKDAPEPVEPPTVGGRLSRFFKKFLSK